MINYFVGSLLKYLPRTFLQRISKPIFYVISILYRGSTVTCPVCNYSLSSFFPYRRSTRSNALCTNCLSLERHRFLYLYLKDIKKIFVQNISILHIAPEICFIEKFREQKKFKYITADLESPLADIKMDIHAIPYEDNYFDVILCSHVFEHIDDDISALKEIGRVLKKNGFGIIMIPFYYPIPKMTYEDKSITKPRERELHFGQSDHLRKYGKDFKERFELSGMDVKIIKPEKILDSSQMKKYVINKSDIIILVSK